MELMFQPLKKYADFTGRARRKEYWLFYLFYFIVYAVLMVLSGAAGAAGGNGGAMGAGLGGIVLMIFALGMLVPSLAVSFRRIHDTNRSAWWLLLGLIPLVNLVLLFFFVQDGTPGQNRFGPDPKGRGAHATAEAFA